MSLKIYLTKEREDKIIRPRYEPTTGEFLGLYETTGFVVIRGDEDEHSSIMATTKTNLSFFFLFTNVEYRTLLAERCLHATELCLKVVNLTHNFQICFSSFHLSLIDARK